MVTREFRGSLSERKTRMRAARSAALIGNPHLTPANSSLASSLAISQSATTTGMTGYPATNTLSAWLAFANIEGGVPFTDTGLLAYGALQNPLVAPSPTNGVASGWMVEFETTSTSVTLQLSCYLAAPLRIRVNDVYVDDATLIPNANGTWYVLLTFATQAARRIAVEVNSASQLSKVFINSGDIIFKPRTIRQFRVLVISDSYGVGNAGTTTAQQIQHRSIWKTMGMYLGAEVVCCAVSGTGLAATNGGFANKYSSRMANIAENDAFRSLDAVIIQGSVNDPLQDKSASEARSELASVITQLRATYPLVPLVATGVFQLTAGRLAQTAAMDAEIAAEVSSRNDSMVSFLSFQAPSFWVPNWDTSAFIHPDKVHLLPIAHQFNGIRAADAVYDLLMAA